MGFALLVILHELGHYSAAKAVGMRVEKFSLFFPPTLWSKKVGETEYAIGAIPAGGYVKITGMNPDEDLPEEVRDRAYHAQPVWKRIVVIAAGPAVNLALAFVLLFVFWSMIGFDTPTRTVGQIEKSYPAAGVLQPGDRLIAVDGKRGAPGRLSNLINAHGCAGPKSEWKPGCRATTPVTVAVERDGRERTFSLTPKYDPAAGDGGRMRVGFGYKPGPRDPLPIGEALDVSASEFWFITERTLELPVRLIDPEKRKEISGVVGSYETTRQVILVDWGACGPHPRDHLALAGDREPVPVPAAGRRPHLLGDRGEGAPQAGLAAGDGARRSRRLHAGDPDLPDRIVERHRPPERRGIQGALAVVPEDVGSSGPPWRLSAAQATSPKEDTG